MGVPIRKRYFRGVCARAAPIISSIIVLPEQTKLPVRRQWVSQPSRWRNGYIREGKGGVDFIAFDERCSVRVSLKRNSVPCNRAFGGIAALREVTVRDLLYWGITTTQRRTSGRLVRSGDLHSTTPKQNSTLSVMTQIAITILTNERWTTRPAHQIICSRKEAGFSHLYGLLLITYADECAPQATLDRWFSRSTKVQLGLILPCESPFNCCTIVTHFFLLHLRETKQYFCICGSAQPQFIIWFDSFPIDSQVARLIVAGI